MHDKPSRHPELSEAREQLAELHVHLELRRSKEGSSVLVPLEEGADGRRSVEGVEPLAYPCNEAALLQWLAEIQLRVTRV